MINTFYQYNFALLITFLGCIYSTEQVKENISKFPCTDQSSVKNANTIKQAYHYIDSLNTFLERLVSDNSSKKRKVYLVRDKKSIKQYHIFQYRSKLYDISVTEKSNSLLSINNILICGNSVTRFVTEPGIKKGGANDITIGNSNGIDSISAYIYDLPTSSYLLLNGTSVNAQGQYSNIVYSVLIPLTKYKTKGFIFSSYNVPNDFYFGYNKKMGKIIYLDIITAFANDEISEFEYIIKGRFINLKTFSTGALKNTKGEQYIIKAVIPNVNDFSNYKIIKSNWWF